ncbi:hypothetical protein ACN26Y_25050 [Micromonospora sp. WMMD558]|uniref:hypothetical protein n=1 Tax=unclassified Micromonospora TaxID=2617518 RepID=UPI001E606533|nr:hypothetical protein [Micromonospora sp. WMMC415]
MTAVQALLDGQDAPTPETQPSAAEPVARATDTQVLVRSLAEQLVSEANSVLAAHDRSIDLVDEAGPGALAFTLACAGRWARVRTVVDGRTALAELVGPDGRTEAEPRRLASEDELRALLLSLIAPARVNRPHH